MAVWIEEGSRGLAHVAMDDFPTVADALFEIADNPLDYRRGRHLNIDISIDKEHGLIGVQLPTVPVHPNGQVTVPPRFACNVTSGYALWLNWQSFVTYPGTLAQLILEATAREKRLILNSDEIKKQNG